MASQPRSGSVRTPREHERLRTATVPAPPRLAIPSVAPTLGSSSSSSSGASGGDAGSSSGTRTSLLASATPVAEQPHTIRPLRPTHSSIGILGLAGINVPRPRVTAELEMALPTVAVPSTAQASGWPALVAGSTLDSGPPGGPGPDPVSGHTGLRDDSEQVLNFKLDEAVNAAEAAASL